jgi:hypothetical protein
MNPPSTLDANLREIESLNQRGGRMLSVVDLIEDGTLDVPAAGYLLAAVAGGAPFMTAAGPGGVGKTTLLGCLLSFLPPGERIVTVTDPAQVGQADGRQCLLCHEIGSGHWYGYLWGRQAAEFLALHRRGRIAAAIHADTLQEIEHQVLGPEIAADPADLAAVDLLAFMVHQRSLRRVSAVFESEGAKQPPYREVIRWEPRSDEFRIQAPEVPAQFGAAVEFVERLVADDVRLTEEVMAAVTGFYRRVPPANRRGG